MDKNPQIRYLPYKDVAQIMGVKNKMSDQGFHSFLKQM